MFTQPNDSIVICPFDESHHILRSRIHYHLIKCVKNHPNSKKVICPYDATEYLDPEEFPNHLFVCKSKITIDSLEYSNDKMSKRKEHGNIPEAAFHYPNLREPDEDWSEGIEMPSENTRLKTASPWNSSLTNQPQKISSKGRGKLLKEYLEYINNRCDGLYCKKSCCPKNTESKGTGRGELLRKLLDARMETKPLGRGALLKMYIDQSLETKTPGPNRINESIKDVSDEEKYVDAEEGRKDESCYSIL